MSTIINDFISCAVCDRGIGHFENDDLAVSFARDMGTNQTRKFERYGIVPKAFMAYLKREKAIPKEICIPERSRTVKVLLDLLWEAPDKHRGVYSKGDALREAFLIEMLPELRNKMGSSQHIWQAFERDGKLHGLKGPGGTAKEPDYLQKP